MQLFGPVHLLVLIGITLAAVLSSLLCRRRRVLQRVVRLALGYGLAVNELIWWAFRYSHEGLRFPVNLPLQLCDVTLWATVLACITLVPVFIEFAYFAGLTGSAMAVLTPDLWSPFPSYPAIYFFVAHGGIIVGAATLVFGRIAPLRRSAVWRAFALLLAYAGVIGAFNKFFGANYMYLCRKPVNASLLDVFGPWPVYLFASAAIGLALFWLLWLPVRPAAGAS